MNATCQTYKEKLFLFAESRLGRSGGLSGQEADEIERHLQSCEDCRNEVNSIINHLRTLSQLPALKPSAFLAARCLAVTARRGVRFPLWNFGMAGAGLLVVVFTCGLWAGNYFHHTPAPVDLFPILLNEQNALIAQLEERLLDVYQEESMTADNPWLYPLAKLKYTSNVIATCYKSDEMDLVVKRGLTQAIYQNILVLQSLCEYLENNPDIPEEDMELLTL